MEPHSNDTLVALGRLEGKLDVLVSNQSQQNSRVDGIESRTTRLEIDVSTIQATRAQSRDWVATAISVVAALAALAAIATPFIGGAHG
ncbi:hypothetical protein [Shinella zoogloeoides]|uniref:hypothetical protein n=1 Tax=Shinella zoogloeoides TaxID=352475 RepID=UPI0028A9480E|nr:hypothetical protein [Shinella zoogloeoides]